MSDSSLLQSRTKNGYLSSPYSLPYDFDGSDASTIYAHSLGRSSMDKSSTSTTDFKFHGDRPSRSDTSLSLKPTRAELNKLIGDDAIPQTTEIGTFPCAGIRISQGRLKDLIAWRFVVQLDEPSSKSRASPRRAVVSNFILDTGSRHSFVPPETLTALGYTGDFMPGAEVTLVIQGVRTQCVVAYPQEAGRLCGRFTMAGSLTYCFKTSLDAPVLYVANEELDGPRPENIPRTVKLTFHQRLVSLICLGLLSKS